MVIVAVDPRMAPLSPTGTAFRAAFGRFAGIHAALLSMPVGPLGYRHGPAGRPAGRSSRRAAPCAALEQFQSEIALTGALHSLLVVFGSVGLSRSRAFVL